MNREHHIQDGEHLATCWCHEPAPSPKQTDVSACGPSMPGMPIPEHPPVIAQEGASETLRDKVAEWHKTCSEYENQHGLEVTHYGSSSHLAQNFHRGAKEAFSRVLNELDAAGQQSSGRGGAVSREWFHHRLGAYLNTMVAELGIDGKGQYLRDLFGRFEEEFFTSLPVVTAELLESAEASAKDVWQRDADDERTWLEVLASEIDRLLRQQPQGTPLAVTGLIAKWRDTSGRTASTPAIRAAYNTAASCADELEALLRQSASGEQPTGKDS